MSGGPSAGRETFSLNYLTTLTDQRTRPETLPQQDAARLCLVKGVLESDADKNARYFT